ncbi:UDP-glycosyltransferase 73C3 [Forsythia ovata]|uniref:UDP-glycosyltransferase 73C3 n=1 Tax=Forsythia ovata TaxID=205694 RepID=A0ABD1R3R8_9LAMI
MADHQVAVVMVPLPAQGHLNQLLHLSRLISAYNIPVHFAGTTTHNRQAKARVHGWDPLATTNIHFHDFSTPPFHNPPPDPNATTKFPSQILPAFHASMELRHPIFSMVEKSLRKGQKTFSLYSFYWEIVGKPLVKIEAEILNEVPSMEGCFVPELSEFSNLQKEAKKFHSGDLFNTNRIIEGFYLDLLGNEKATGTDKIWAIGPFNPVVIPERKNSNSCSHKCLQWLDKQASNSVIFISFGSTSSLSDEQIKELALGLEKSGKKFIWVLRDADKGNVFEGDVRRASLPEGN